MLLYYTTSQRKQNSWVISNERNICCPGWDIFIYFQKLTNKTNTQTLKLLKHWITLNNKTGDHRTNVFLSILYVIQQLYFCINKVFTPSNLWVYNPAMKRMFSVLWSVMMTRNGGLNFRDVEGGCKCDADACSSCKYYFFFLIWLMNSETWLLNGMEKSSF